MASLFLQNGFYYIRYYDKRFGFTRKKSTHVKDIREAKKILKAFTIKLLTNKLEDNFGYKHQQIILSEGLKEYLEKKNYREKTKGIYNLAVKHFINSCGDKYVEKINTTDYYKFLDRLKGKSQNSRSIWSRHLSALWNYFVSFKYCERNIIERVEGFIKQVQTIPYKDIQKILKVMNNEHRLFVNFLLHTGCRISTALALKWSDIDKDFINFSNVKIKQRYFQFPITKQVKEILGRVNGRVNGRVFPFSSVKFWYRTQTKLNMKYGIHQLRKTFLSNMANKGISIDELSKITDTDSRTLRKYYVKMDIKQIGKKISGLEKDSKRV